MQIRGWGSNDCNLPKAENMRRNLSSMSVVRVPMYNKVGVLFPRLADLPRATRRRHSTHARACTRELSLVRTEAPTGTDPAPLLWVPKLSPRPEGYHRGRAVLPRLVYTYISSSLALSVNHWRNRIGLGHVRNFSRCRCYIQAIVREGERRQAPRAQTQNEVKK